MSMIVVCGAGKIGRFVAVLLASCGSYQVTMIDVVDCDKQCQSLIEQYPHLSFKKIDTQQPEFADFLKHCHAKAVISCLPFRCNVAIAQAACDAGCHYLDLTEDRETQVAIANIAEGAAQVFVPQCGVAPGLVDVVGHDLMQQFDTLASAQLCVGALPQQVSNDLHYELSWSIDGLVNEYMNACEVIEDGQLTEVPALTGLCELKVQGEQYEIFHTSGGLSTLADYYLGKIQHLHYKTIRYPGHVERVHTLFKELNSDHDRLVQWFKDNIPFTEQDMVIMYVNVIGRVNDELHEKSYLKKWFPMKHDQHQWTAIQWLTASEVCAVCDVLLTAKQQHAGLMKPQDISLAMLKENRFMRPLAI